MDDDDWRNWKNGRYDNRYEGVGKHSGKRHYGRRKYRAIKIAIISIVLAAASLFVLIGVPELPQLQIPHFSLPSLTQPNPVQTNPDSSHGKTNQPLTVGNNQIVISNCIMASNGIGGIRINCENHDSVQCISNPPIGSGIQKEVILTIDKNTCEVQYQNPQGGTSYYSFELGSSSNVISLDTKPIENSTNTQPNPTPSLTINDLSTQLGKIKNLINDANKPQQTSQDESKLAVDYINTIRTSYGDKPIQFDQRAFALGLARAKDMYDYGYLDHVNPITGSCSYSIKSQFGFAENEYLAENALGFETKQEVSNSNGDYHTNIDSWMGDTGHKMNLLYLDHYGGAYACYGSQCVFEGVNHDQFVLGCHTAQEGAAGWNKMASCTDEQLMQYQALQQQLDAMKPKLQGMPSVATTQEQYSYYNGLVSQYNNLVNQINNFKC